MSTTPDLIRAELRELRLKYWKMLSQIEKESNPDKRKDLRKQNLNWYIDEMLPKLVTLAQLQTADFPDQVNVLVLLVGTSIEPLLISAATLKPKQIILVLNQNYKIGGQSKNWDTYGDEVKDYLFNAVSAIPGWSLSKDKIEPTMVWEDQPDYVFAVIRHKLAEHQSTKVVVDVTGSKKSMMTGAFEYAALSPNTDISYVDFDDYDDSKNRPLDETCIVGFLSNPYETFALRDWEHVQRLYERYAFKEANLILQGPLNRLEQMEQFFTNDKKELAKQLGLEGQAQAARNLRDIFNVYHEWHIGNHSAAASLYQHSRLADRCGSFTLPVAVPKLSDFDGSYYENPLEAIYFAQDELEKIRIVFQTTENFHSVYVRCHGLHEFLLRTRLHILSKKEQIGVPFQGKWHALSGLEGKIQNIDEIIGKVQYGIREGYTMPRMGYILLRDNQIDNKYKPKVTLQTTDGKCTEVFIQGMPKTLDYPESLTLSEFGAGLGMNAKQFSARRNKLIHENKFPLRNEAEKAYKFICAAFLDFLTQWAPRAVPPVNTDELPPSKNFRPLAWQDLCQLLELKISSTYNEEPQHEPISPCR